MTGQIECPHCGKKMAIGYPSCISCKKPLASEDSPLKKIARSKKATYIVSPEEPKSIWPWILLGLAALSVLYFFFRGEKETPDVPRQSQSVYAPQASASASPFAQQSEDDQIAEDDATEPTQTPSSTIDLDQLNQFNQDLLKASLYSNVSNQGEDGSTVVIQSASCGSDNMTTIASSNSGDLKDAGFKKIQCFAKHGALVFETEL